MKEIKGDIWDFHKRGYWIVITTNGNVKVNGEAVMGKGIALQAAKRFPDLPIHLGQRLETMGNRLNPFPNISLFCFPTKWDWRDKSDLCLIAVSASQLVDYLTEAYISVKPSVYLPRPGCGNGQLDWKDVKPILEKYLDDRFVVVNR